jgi:predicted SAM-dependent methyltransferase
MNEILRDRASKNGVTVLPVDISASLPEMTEAFDVIAAYDVLEHIDFDSVISLMNSLEKLLKPGGHIVFRFPNGQSPFGRYLQHADYTHKSTLSSAIMTQIISGTRLILVRDDQGSFTARGSLIQSIPSYLKHIIRKTIEKFIRVIFDIRCELSPNIVLVLRKKM